MSHELFEDVYEWMQLNLQDHMDAVGWDQTKGDPVAAMQACEKDQKFMDLLGTFPPAYAAEMLTVIVTEGYDRLDDSMWDPLAGLDESVIGRMHVAEDWARSNILEAERVLVECDERNINYGYYTLIDMYECRGPGQHISRMEILWEIYTDKLKETVDGL